MGINGRDLIRPFQVHGASVRTVDRRFKGRGAFDRLSALKETDALITAQRFLPIAVLTADCLPVFLFDPRKRVIAIIHAGWRGVNKRIITTAIQKMSGVFKTSAEDLIAVLGPAMRSCCYEVGREFIGFFGRNVVSTRDNKLYFDLAGAAAEEMREAGISVNSIFDTNICTSCLNGEFFSYRREGTGAGRSMSVLELS